MMTIGKILYNQSRNTTYLKVLRCFACCLLINCICNFLLKREFWFKCSQKLGRRPASCRHLTWALNCIPMHYLNIALEKYNVLNFKVWRTNSKILEAYESSHYTIALSDLFSNVFAKASQFDTILSFFLSSWKWFTPWLTFLTF